MGLRSLLLTVAAISAIFLLLPLSTMAQTSSSVLYGYVSMDGAPVNGASVTITCYTSGGNDQQTVTANDPVSGHPGYYSFNITTGSGYSITASYLGHNSPPAQQMVSLASVRVDLNILSVTPTPKPTVTITPTPTPKPSGGLGGPVQRNNTSYFTPIAVTNPSATPVPIKTVTPSPTTMPSATPAPTPVPSSGIFSNIYVVLLIVLIAILVIAAAALLIWYRYF